MNEKNKKKAYSTWSSQVVSYPSTTQALIVLNFRDRNGNGFIPTDMAVCINFTSFHLIYFEKSDQVCPNNTLISGTCGDGLNFPLQGSQKYCRFTQSLPYVPQTLKQP